jgi:Glycosyl transferase family 21
MMSTGRLPVEVVVPLRWDGESAQHGADVEEMAAYLEELSRHCDITVVDGSSDAARCRHREAWGGSVRTLEPEGAGLNGKVVGALTGVRHARHEVVVLADDDVRHDRATLTALLEAAADADVVRPQNVYTRWTWPARWDFGRCLVARAFGADWPGTFALRRSAIVRMGGWSTEVLFENLQMVRTAEAQGLRLTNAPWLVVPRTPPSIRQFRSQRVRQAYDDFAQPVRLLLELAVLPTLATVAVRRPRLLVGALAVPVLLGEVGRRRFGGLPVPRSASLWCTLWVLERGVCVWVAVGAWCRGGVRYRGRRVRYAALPSRASTSPTT